MRLGRFASLVAAAFLSAQQAAAQEVTFVVHHFLAPVANAHKAMIVPWTEKVTAESGGRIAFEIFPAMSLGGKPAELYGQVRDGTADIVWTLLGYTPGVFPRAEVFELPTVHTGSATATTIALNAAFDLIAEDFREVKVIFLHSHDGNLIQTAARPVRAIEDVRGLKLRTPSRTGAWVIEAMGAEPVAMPVTALSEAMARGTVDGAMTTLEVVPSIKLEELVRHTTEPPEGDRMGTSVFMLAMNRDAYEALPADLRAVIDANSGVNVAAGIGAQWEGFEQGGIDALAAAGAERIILDEAAAAPFRAASEAVVARWIAEVTAAGIDGQGLVDAARAAVAAAAR